MTVVNSIFDFGKFYVVTEIADTATTIDIVASSLKYTMEDQKNPGTLFTSGRLVVIDKDDDDKFITIAFSNCVANGDIGGFKRYTLTIRTASDAESTVMMGLANSDDGSNSITNVIAGNKSGIFPVPADSLCLVSVGSAEYQEMLGKFTTALSEISEQTDQLAMKIFFAMKSIEQRNIDARDSFELDLQGQQDSFESGETAARNAFEALMQANFNSFVATQREITATINANTAKYNVSSGNWLDGLTPRNYAGVLASAVTFDAVNYVELVVNTGALAVNTSGFNSGNFPVAKITANASEIVSIINYGASFQVSGAAGGFDGVITSPVYTDGLLTSFTDGDSTDWTLTYDANNQLLTMSDGTDTTTISRDSSGNFLTTILT